MSFRRTWGKLSSSWRETMDIAISRCRAFFGGGGGGEGGGGKYTNPRKEKTQSACVIAADGVLAPLVSFILLIGSRCHSVSFTE